MEVDDIVATFDDFKEHLTALFDKYKDLPERYLKKVTELTYYTDVFNVFNESQIMGMVKHLEKVFCNGKTGEVK